MLVYKKFSLFLENVAVSFHASSSLDSVSSSQLGLVGLYLGARYIIRFGYFIDWVSVVLPGEVENWFPKVGSPRVVHCDDEADSVPKYGSSYRYSIIVRYTKRAANNVSSTPSAPLRF